eukprot:554314_1
MDADDSKLKYDVSKCMEILKQNEMYDNLLNNIENDANVANINPDDNEEVIKQKTRQWLISNKKLLFLKNEICKILLSPACNNPNTFRNKYLWKAPIPEIIIPEEPLEIVANARHEWDKRLRYQLRTLSVQQKRPLVQKQVMNESSDSSSSEVLSLRYIYTCEDLLETIANIVNTNNNSLCNMRWGLIKLDLNTPNLADLRAKFKELHPRYKHLGVDDIINQNNKNNNFLQERIKQGIEILENPYIPQLREYGKFGIPAGLRSKFWNEIIVINNDEEQSEEDKDKYFNYLLDKVDDIDMITDCLYRLDVDQTVDHPDFFPFDDFLNDIMLAFSRDNKINEMSSIRLNTAVLTENKKETESIPPCHVIPFHQQTLLCAPLCLLFTDPKNGYFLFRKIFCKYLCKLHIISSKQNTILYLCKLFETLTSYLYPNLYFHIVNKIGIQPLTIVFPWIFTGFASYLKNSEVLNIWDRIISYNDNGDGLLLLPIICCAIFGFRKDNLLKSENQENIHSVFQDLKTIKVIPLLQHFLFSTR